MPHHLPSSRQTNQSIATHCNTMAKAQKNAPKKRTKTAVIARKYERKLKQRIKAGEPKAKDIFERRKEYHRQYEAKRKQRQEDERRSATHVPTEAEVRELGEEERGDDDGAAEIDRAMGEPEDVRYEDNEYRETNPLFCTPAPPSGLMRPVSMSDERKTSVMPQGSKDVRSKGSVQTTELGDSATKAGEAPLWQRRMQASRRGFPMAKRYGAAAQRALQEEASHGNLSRRSLRGSLIRSPSSSSTRCEDPQESIEKLESLRAKIKKDREALLSKEVNVEIKLRRLRERG